MSEENTALISSNRITIEEYNESLTIIARDAIEGQYEFYTFQTVNKDLLIRKHTKAVIVSNIEYDIKSGICSVSVIVRGTDITLGKVFNEHISDLSYFHPKYMKKKFDHIREQLESVHGDRIYKNGGTVDV